MFIGFCVPGSRTRNIAFFDFIVVDSTMRKIWKRFVFWRYPFIRIIAYNLLGLLLARVYIFTFYLFSVVVGIVAFAERSKAFEGFVVFYIYLFLRPVNNKTCKIAGRTIVVA